MSSATQVASHTDLHYVTLMIPAKLYMNRNPYFMRDIAMDLPKDIHNQYFQLAGTTTVDSYRTDDGAIHRMAASITLSFQAPIVERFRRSPYRTTTEMTELEQRLPINIVLPIEVTVPAHLSGSHLATFIRKRIREQDYHVCGELICSAEALIHSKLVRAHQAYSVTLTLS